MKHTKLLIAMPAVLGMGLVGAGLLVGCGSPNGAQTETAKTETAAKTDAPAGSSAQESAAKTGEHHADAAEAAKAHTHSTKLAFSAAPSAIPVGKPATWTLQINDAKSGRAGQEL